MSIRKIQLKTIIFFLQLVVESGDINEVFEQI